MRPTRKIYHEDSFQFSLDDACVVELISPTVATSESDNKAKKKKKKKTTASGDGEPRVEIVLDSTVLFPEGGGQKSDRGWLVFAPAQAEQRRIPVLDVVHEKQRDVVRHVVRAADAETLRLGDKVRVEVDKARRLDHAQQHSGQHLISALAETCLDPPLQTIAWGLGVDTCTIDFDTESVSQETLEKLEKLANDAIGESRPISVTLTRPEDLEHVHEAAANSEFIRHVIIEGVDRNMCCGTHLNNTSQIRAVHFCGQEKMRDKARVHFLAGDRVLRFTSSALEQARQLRALFSCQTEDIVERATKRLDELKESQRSLRALIVEASESVAKSLASEVSNNDTCFVESHRDRANIDFFKSTIASVASVRPDVVLFLTASSGTSPETHFFLVASGDKSNAELVARCGAKAAELLEGKGGGRGARFQGKCASLARRADVVALLRAEVEQQQQQ